MFSAAFANQFRTNTRVAPPNRHHAIRRGRPYKASALQSFREQTGALPVVPNQFYAVAAASSENKDRPRWDRVSATLAPARQWEAFPHIGMAHQLQRCYNGSWETFLGNAGLVQCFANGDQATLDYIARRLERLVAPFELRTAFSRQRFSQLLMIEGEPPEAAIRLEQEDVARIRLQAVHAVGRAERP